MADEFKMPDLGGIMQAAQRVQGEMAKVQEALGSKTVEGSVGGGMVTVVANGRQEVISIRIEKSVVDPTEIEMLQDLVVAGVNQAMGKARDMAQAEMAKVTGGLSIPGLG